jgi:hypothetical protein
LVLIILVPGDTAEAAAITVVASAALVAAGTADYDFVATVAAADYVAALLAANVSNTHFS